MTWFWLALIGPIVWSLSNHIDKVLLSKYFRGKSSAPLVLISTLASIFTIVPLGLYLGDVSLPIEYIFGFIALGTIEACYLFPYFKALETGEASAVTPLFQLEPLLYFVVAFFVLGEVLTFQQFVGIAILLLGSLLTIMDIHTFRFRWKPFYLIVSACCILVLSGVLFKGLALEENFWKAVFWQSVGVFALGIFLLFLPKYRKGCYELIEQSRGILILNFFNETLSIIGFVAMRYASFIVPMALANAVSGFQPFFIFCWGVLGAWLWPSLGFEEDLRYRAIMKKLLAAGLLLTGAWLIK